MPSATQKPVDPLYILYCMMMGLVSKYKNIVRAACIFGLMTIHSFNIISLMEIIYYMNYEDIVTRMNILVLTLPSTALLILVAMFSEELSKTNEVISTIFLTLETRGIAFQTRIKKEAKLCTIRSFAHHILSIFAIFSILFCENKSTTLVINTIANLSLISRWCAHFFLVLATFYIAVVPNVASFYVTYIAYHLKFQYHILKDYLKENIRSCIDMDDENEQGECQLHLRNCVDHILKIQRGMKILTVMSNHTFLTVYLLAVPTFALSAYSFFIQNMSLKTNSLEFWTAVKIVTIFFNGCIDGQRIVNESISSRSAETLRRIMMLLPHCNEMHPIFFQSTDFYHFICRAPWIHWNKTNRMTLLMILANTQKPLKISSFGYLHLDYTLMIKAVRLSYTLLTLMPKIIK